LGSFLALSGTNFHAGLNETEAQGSRRDGVVPVRRPQGVAKGLSEANWVRLVIPSY
jgi:hypothetical protein